MLDADYVKLATIMGKLARFYDQAGSQTADQQLRLARWADQYADGTAASVPQVILFGPSLPSCESAIQSGSVSIQNWAKGQAIQYLTSSDFTIRFVANIPANPNDVTVVLASLVLEMTTNSKTYTTIPGPATGISNFLNQVAGSVLSLPTAADASASYKDSVYATDTIV